MSGSCWLIASFNFSGRAGGYRISYAAPVGVGSTGGVFMRSSPERPSARTHAGSVEQGEAARNTGAGLRTRHHALIPQYTTDPTSFHFHCCPRQPRIGDSTAPKPLKTREA